MNSGPANGSNIATPDWQRCPECDAADSWQATRRHRFSPFGAVLLAVLAFWSALAGWFLGFGYVLAAVLITSAVVVTITTRTAEICDVCGFVRPGGH
ncbi:MAG TPA: hypothetical protein QGG30_04960 [Acidobacteriota bacterium]|jgi:hypothetical protein|nr:hypothetical protein [Acidobacteriota bacterium]MEE3273974.1 hypothetical protein [Acidobacteriota bacterium]HJO29820.1 hypothetical protein [Acidobacteriota bacterium]